MKEACPFQSGMGVEVGGIHTSSVTSLSSGSKDDVPPQDQAS